MSIEYKGFRIECSPKPISYRGFDYDWCHLDYDGEGDNRIGQAASVEDCKTEIDQWILENAEVVMGTDVMARGQLMQIEQVDGDHYLGVDQEGESHWIADHEIDHVY